jgi:hypothetical protein
VWELIDRRMKFYHGHAKEFIFGDGDEKYYKEYYKIKALTEELNEKGTNREKQILELYND